MIARRSGCSQNLLVEFLLHGLREITDQLAAQVGVFGDVGLDQPVIQPELGIRQDHCELRARQPLPEATAVGHLVFRRQGFQCPVQGPRALQRTDHVRMFGDALDRMGLDRGQRLALQVVAAQHQRADFPGHARQQFVAPDALESPALHGAAQQDLDVDLDVGAVDPARVVDEVGVDAAAVHRVLDAAALRQSEVAPLADDTAAQFVPIDPNRVVIAIADFGVGFLRGLDVGADTPVPEQVDLHLQDRADDVAGRRRGRVDAEHLARLGRQGQGLRAAREDAAALRDEAGVVVLPAGAGQPEHAAALRETAGGVRLRVQEDVLVVEGGEQPDVLREQQAVAEDVARHVADADDGEVLRLDVDADLAEMPLDTLPSAACRDTHFLVVVAGRAAGSEGVAEPVAVLGGDRVGDVREAGRALVGSNHQVGIVRVGADHVRRWDHLAADEVVGEVEQGADEQPVAFGAFGLGCVARGRQPPRDEAALRADRHDHGVLDVLRLHQAENLGAEVLAPVGPADAAACDLAHAQVHALDARRVHEDLEHRARQRCIRHGARIDLDRQVGTGRAVVVLLVVARTQRRVDRRQEGADDAVVVDPGDVGEDLLQRLAVPGFELAARGRLDGWVEAGLEQADKMGGGSGIRGQRLLHVGL